MIDELEQEVIEMHLTMIDNKWGLKSQYLISHNDRENHLSPLVALMRDVRGITGRNKDGEIIDKNKNVRFRLGIGGYMIVLDHIGGYYKLKKKPICRGENMVEGKEKKGPSNDFENALYWFSDLGLDDIKVLYKYRCALLHDYKLSHTYKKEQYSFQLCRNGKIIEKKSEGDYIIDPIAFCSLIETIYKKMIEYFKEKQLELNQKTKAILKEKGKTGFLKDNFIVYVE